MGQSPEDLLSQIKRKAEDLSNFSEHSNSSEKSKCFTQLRCAFSDYLVCAEGASEGGNRDYTPLVKLLTRDVHWFSKSSFRKGITHVIGKLLLSMATCHPSSAGACSSILIKISCMVFQWNDSEESLAHAAVFLNFLHELLSRSTADVNSDSTLVHTVQLCLLHEMKMTKTSSPKVAETRVFMILSCLKSVVHCRPSFPVTETLLSVLFFARQLPSLPKSSSDSKSAASQHISFRLQKLFTDDSENAGRGRRLGRVSQQNSLDISSDYHFVDHHGSQESDLVNNSLSGPSESDDEEKRPKGQGPPYWLPKDLRSWIKIRRRFLISTLPGVISGVVLGWILDSFETGKHLFEHMRMNLTSLIHTLVCSLKGMEQRVVTVQPREAWVHAAGIGVMLSCMQSPVLYIHSILENLLLSIRHLYEYNFEVDSTREGYFMPSHERMKSGDTGTGVGRENQETPMGAVNGLKLSCHFLVTLIAHFSCVAVKDCVRGIIFLSSLVENSISLLRQGGLPEDSTNQCKALSSAQRELLQMCSAILSSYLAYLLIHKHCDVYDQIFVHKNISLRNSLMAVYDDSLASCDCDNGEVEMSSSPTDTEGMIHQCYCKKCVDLTHPLLASYLCSVTMPRLGISATCTGHSASSHFNNADEFDKWYDEQIRCQESHFCHDDLLSLDLSQLLVWMDCSCDDSGKDQSSWSAGNIGEAHGMSLADIFPVERWPCGSSDNGDGKLNSCLPNVHHFLRSKKDMRVASSSFMVQSAFSRCTHLEDSESECCPEEDEYIARRRVAAADRVFSYDICTVLMGYVSTKRICRLACVNKQFALAAACPLVWQRKYAAKFDKLVFDITPPPPAKKRVKHLKGGMEEGKERGSGALEPQCVVPSSRATENAQLLCQHCWEPIEESSPRGRGRAKKTICCNGLVKKHNWRYLFQVKVLLGKSLKADQLKSKRGGNGSVPKICPVVGCVFTFRTDKQREAHFAKQHGQISNVLTTHG